MNGDSGKRKTELEYIDTSIQRDIKRQRGSGGGRERERKREREREIIMADPQYR